MVRSAVRPVEAASESVDGRRLTPSTPQRAAPAENRIDVVDQWGEQSFPASDPPQNW